MAGVVILTLQRPDTSLSEVLKWFGATNVTALSSHLSDVRDGNGTHGQKKVTSFYL